jgi:hypothetical protein
MSKGGKKMCWSGEAEKWWKKLEEEIINPHRKCGCKTRAGSHKTRGEDSPYGDGCAKPRPNCTVHEKQNAKGEWRTIFQVYDSAPAWEKKNCHSNSIGFLLGYEKFHKEGLGFLVEEDKEFAEKVYDILLWLGGTIYTKGDKPHLHLQPRLSLNTIDERKFNLLIEFINKIEECVVKNSAEPLKEWCGKNKVPSSIRKCTTA